MLKETLPVSVIYLPFIRKKRIAYTLYDKIDKKSVIDSGLPGFFWTLRDGTVIYEKLRFTLELHISLSYISAYTNFLKLYTQKQTYNKYTYNVTCNIIIH